MDHVSLCLGSAPGPAAAATVRRAATARFGHLLPPAVLADLLLLSTELIANAVQHGQGHVVVHLQLTADEVKVEVVDEGPGFRTDVGAIDPDPEGRWGLAVVSRAASRWGVRAGASQVWFALDLARA